MKIDKDYLRQLIRESLEEASNFTPATLPYEVGQEESKTTNLQIRLNPRDLVDYFFSDAIHLGIPYVKDALADAYPEYVQKYKYRKSGR